VRVEAGWEVSGCRSEAALTITDCTPLAKVHLRAPWNGAMAKALGVPFGRADRDGASQVGASQDGASQDGGWLVVGSGPGEWLVLAPPDAAAAVTDWLGTVAGDEFVSVTDLTHGRALVRVTGPDAADLLARLCGADLDDDMAPDGAALRSGVAGVATDIVRDDTMIDGAAVPSYLLHCERSSGQYLFGALVSAGESLGIGVDGFRLPGI
jgi:heterotetrameric sarcosine oxidase gamma subunit